MYRDIYRGLDQFEGLSLVLNGVCLKFLGVVLPWLGFYSEDPRISHLYFGGSWVAISGVISPLIGVIRYNYRL